MLKKKLISAVTAVCMGVTLLSSFAVSAAEKTLAPWSVYYAPKDENQNYSNWLKGNVVWENGCAKLPQSEGSELILQNRTDGYATLKVAADSKGYNAQYGAAAIGFTAANAGDYQIYFYADNNSPEPNSDKGIAIANFGSVDKSTNTITMFDTAVVDGYASGDYPTTTYTKTVSLDKDEELVAKFASSYDGFKRVMNIKYQVTDLTTGIVYDYNKIGNVIVPEAPLTKTSWDLSEYYKSNDKDNSMWSVYMAGNMADYMDSSDTYSDMTAWQEYPIENYRSASTNGIHIQNGETEFEFYDSCPEGWFWWRPAACKNSNGKGTAVIGWTAPEAGTYAFEFEAFNKGQGDAKSTEGTNHIIGYKKNGETVLTVLDSFDVPAANTATLGKFAAQYKLEAGETIYLLNDAGSDGWGDSVDMKYKVTNINDTSKSWSASDMYKNELTDSPYRLWYSKHGETDISKYFAANLLYHEDEGRVIASKNADWGGNYLSINNDGSFNARPESDDDIGGNLGITFDVPADGFYKVSLDIQNINNEGTEDDWYETSRAVLYHLSGRNSNVGDKLEDTGRIKRIEKSEFTHLLSAKKGDKILLNINADNNSWMIHLKGHYNITKLEKFNYSYKQGTSTVSAVSELTQGETLTASLDYVDNKAQNLTLVTAVFNAEGTMTAIGVSDPVTSVAGQPAAVSASLTVPEITAGTVVRTFIVDGLNSLVPLNTPDVLE